MGSQLQHGMSLSVSSIRRFMRGRSNADIELSHRRPFSRPGCHIRQIEQASKATGSRWGLGLHPVELLWSIRQCLLCGTYAFRFVSFHAAPTHARASQLDT